MKQTTKWLYSCGWAHVESNKKGKNNLSYIQENYNFRVYRFSINQKK